MKKVKEPVFFYAGQKLRGDDALMMERFFQKEKALIREAWERVGGNKKGIYSEKA